MKEQNDVEKNIRVNGTALLYPYVRSVISTLSSVDSESAILLPTLNTHIFGQG